MARNLFLLELEPSLCPDTAFGIIQWTVVSARAAAAVKGMRVVPAAAVPGAGPGYRGATGWGRSTRRLGPFRASDAASYVN